MPRAFQERRNRNVLTHVQHCMCNIVCVGTMVSGRTVAPMKTVSDKQKGALLRFLAPNPANNPEKVGELQESCPNDRSPCNVVPSAIPAGDTNLVTPHLTQNPAGASTSHAPTRTPDDLIMVEDMPELEQAPESPRDQEPQPVGSGSTDIVQPTASAPDTEAPSVRKRSRASIEATLLHEDMCLFTRHEEDASKMLCVACNSCHPRLAFRLKQHVQTSAHKAAVRRANTQAQECAVACFSKFLCRILSTVSPLHLYASITQTRVVKYDSTM
jgi:hypothetical protein